MNMSHRPLQGSVFVYVGKGSTHNERHIVVNGEPNDVITWSCLENPTDGGTTWRGDGNAFCKNFKTLDGQKPMILV